MFYKKMPSLTIGNHRASIPVIQGGMGVGISLSGLASSVAHSGGIGVIAANAVGMIDLDYFVDGKAANIRALRSEIRKARKMSSGVLGVNIMVATNDFKDLMRVSIEEKIDIMILGAGLPIKGIPVDECRKNNVAVVPIVSSARAASLIFRSWEKKYSDIPDAVIVEGPEAGGHIGFKQEQIEDPSYSLECLVPEVIETVGDFSDKYEKNIPVIAAGGIYTGEDIFNIMRKGASGVQMGTRFVVTDECDAHENFKKAYIASCKENLKIIKSPVGMIGRAIENNFLKKAHSGEKMKFACPWKCLASCKAESANYCISIALDNARRGNLEEGYAFAGSNAFRTEEIVPVKKLISTLWEEYCMAVGSCWEKLNSEYARMLDNLVSLKEDYVFTVDRTVSRIKEDYESSVKKFSDFKVECTQTFEKNFTSVKKEYFRKYEKGLVFIKNETDSVFEKMEKIRTDFRSLMSSYGIA
ncbi:MAG: nitronate monooxygenase [bacterium]